MNPETLLLFILNNGTHFNPQNPYPNEHAARIKDPSDFKEKPDWSTGGQFRRTNGGTIYGTIQVPATIAIIWGQLKTQSGKEAQPQALRFPTKYYTAEKAKAWLKEKNVKHISFEAAAPAGAQKNNFVARVGSWFSFENLSPESADIYIYEEIGRYGIGAKQFVQELNKITAKKINVHINSPGGSVWQGIAIFTALNNAKNKIINTFIDGIAASITSLIALAGDFVTIAENAFFFIHEPSGDAMGTADTMRHTAEELDKIRDQLANAYQRKTGMDLEEIKRLMKQETLYNAQEALAAGFVDNIADAVPMTACFDLTQYGYKNFARYEKFKNTLTPKNEGGSKMDPKTLKEKYPELYQEIFNLGKDAGLIEGKAAGKTEGLTEGKTSGKLEGVTEGKAAGVLEGAAAGLKAERERIQAIEALSRPGFEKIVNENKFKPEMTADKVKALITEAESKLTQEQKDKLAADGAALAALASGVHQAAPAGAAAEESDFVAKMAASVNADRGGKAKK